jgi:hypothetical protein
MHQIFTLLGQVAQAILSNPQATQITVRLLHAAAQGYQRLSPANKAKVDSILFKCGGMVAKLALGDLIDWAGVQAVSAGLDAKATELVQIGAKRVAEVGVDKALEEMRRA